MFRLNLPAIDWLTITTFNPVCLQYLDTWGTGVAKHSDREKKRLQYTGKLHHNEEGSLYVGTGEQKGRPHHLVQASGLLADSAWTIARPFILGGTANITRIDLQVTVEYDRQTWDMAKMADYLRADDRGMSVSYLESQSGPAGSKLATVYYGSRSSDRFVRIYEKMGLGEDVFLRFEVEYKSPRAFQVARALAEDADARSILRGELDRVEDPQLSAQFACLHDADAYPVQAVKPEPATLKWLREQVAPALDRVVRDHDIDSNEIEALFRRILGD